MTAKYVKKLNWQIYEDALINLLENKMLQTLYIMAIEDLKIDYKHRPFLTDDVRSAHRSFYDAINSDENALAQNPEQYALILLGTVTVDEEGEVHVKKDHKTMLTGTEALEASEVLENAS